MNKNWEAAFQWLMKEEGGFVNDPRDKGGATNMGVTQAAWEEYIGHSVTESSMKALTMGMVKPFYQSRYWARIKGDGLPSGVDYCVFDMAVNSGPAQAARFIQRVCAVTADGIIGQKTLDAIHSDDPAELINAFCNDRLEWLKTLSGFKTFGRGWASRIERVRKRALTLLS